MAYRVLCLLQLLLRSLVLFTWRFIYFFIISYSLNCYLVIISTLILEINIRYFLQFFNLFLVRLKFEQRHCWQSQTMVTYTVQHFKPSYTELHLSLFGERSPKQIYIAVQRSAGWWPF